MPFPSPKRSCLLVRVLPPPRWRVGSCDDFLVSCAILVTFQCSFSLPFFPLNPVERAVPTSDNDPLGSAWLDPERRPWLLFFLLMSFWLSHKGHPERFFLLRFPPQNQSWNALMKLVRIRPIAANLTNHDRLTVTHVHGFPDCQFSF